MIVKYIQTWQLQDSCEWIGFACQGFGCRVASGRSFQKLPPCPSPRWLQAKAISTGGRASGIRVKKGEKNPEKNASGERSERNSPAGTKGGEGAADAGAEILWQPVVKAMVRHLCPCSPWRNSTCSPWRSPQGRDGCLKKAVWSPHRSRFLAGLVPLEQPVPEGLHPVLLGQAVKNCSPGRGLSLGEFGENCLCGSTPTLEQGQSEEFSPWGGRSRIQE